MFTVQCKNNIHDEKKYLLLLYTSLYNKWLVVYDDALSSIPYDPSNHDIEATNANYYG